MLPYQSNRPELPNSGVSLYPELSLPRSFFGFGDNTGAPTSEAVKVRESVGSTTWRTPLGARPRRIDTFAQLVELIRTYRYRCAHSEDTAPPPSNRGPGGGFPMPPRALYLPPRKARKHKGRKRQHRKKR